MGMTMGMWVRSMNNEYVGQKHDHGVASRVLSLRIWKAWRAFTCWVESAVEVCGQTSCEFG